MDMEVMVPGSGGHLFVSWLGESDLLRHQLAPHFDSPSSV